MSTASENARKAMKSKIERIIRADPRGTKIDASGYTPPDALDADVKTGMRPISKRAYKRGGKVKHFGHADGEAARVRADRKPRKSGGSALSADSLINRDVREANKERDGEKHIGGFKKGGRTGKMDGGSMGAQGMMPAGNNPRVQALMQQMAARGRPGMAPSAGMPPGAGMPIGRKAGGRTEHSDEAMDRKLVKKMVKPSARTGRAGGGNTVGDDYTYVPGEKVQVRPDAEQPDTAALNDWRKRLQTNPDAHKSGGKVRMRADGGETGMEKPIAHHVVDRRTGEVVGRFKNSRAATNMRDRKDIEHGSSRYSRVPVYADDERSERKHGGQACEVTGTRPTGGRMARATGGKAGKAKTNVNIIIASKPDGGMRGAGLPPGVMPPRPPVPVAPPAPMPPQGAMPQGAPPMPMGMPMAPQGGMPPGAMAGAPPPAQMPRKAGGRASYPIDAGAGGGKARLEKIKAYSGG